MTLVVQNSRAASKLTLEEQEFGLRFFLSMMAEIRPHATVRDINRSVRLGAEMLGVKYERLHRMLKLAAVHGPAAAIADAPNEIRFLSGEGFIYFAGEPGGNRIKIGFSANPELRLAAITRLTGIRLQEMRRFPGYMIQEHVCHVICRPAWLGGEWYDADLLKKLKGFRFLELVEVRSA